MNTTTHTNGNYNTTTRLTTAAAAAPPPRSRRCVRTWHDMTRTIWHYERIEQIGEGTYGQVYKARCKDTNTIVALKKIRVHHGAHWGMPPTVIREIKILKRLVHPNLVRMVEVVSSKGVEHLDVDDYHRGSDRSRSSSNKNNKRLSADGGGGGGRTDKNDNDTNNAVVLSATAAADTTINTKKLSSSTTTICSSNASSSKNGDAIADARERYKGNLFLVLEYVPHDLTGLLDVAYKFNDLEIKCIFKQLLQALEYMHSEKYVHRDIKSSNILIDRNFRLKLADFGLARSIEPPLLDKLHDRGNSQEFTNKVITLWYRPPELLLGATRYGTAVDIWSAGCILAELVLGRPLFTGKTEMEQLRLIFDMVGTPTATSWPGVQDLKLLRTGDVTIDNYDNSNDGSAGGGGHSNKNNSNSNSRGNNRRRPKLRERYSNKMNSIAPGAINLVEKLLELDPSKRLTASRALTNRYFLQEPRAPDQPEQLGYEMDLAIDGSFHEFETKKKRKEAKVEAEKARQTALDGGQSSKHAQEEYDAMYRGIMEQVAREGLNPTVASSNQRTSNSNTIDSDDKYDNQGMDDGIAAGGEATTAGDESVTADDDIDKAVAADSSRGRDRSSRSSSNRHRRSSKSDHSDKHRRSSRSDRDRDQGRHSSTSTKDKKDHREKKRRSTADDNDEVTAAAAAVGGGRDHDDGSTSKRHRDRDRDRSSSKRKEKSSQRSSSRRGSESDHERRKRRRRDSSSHGDDGEKDTGRRERSNRGHNDKKHCEHNRESSPSTRNGGGSVDDKDKIGNVLLSVTTTINKTKDEEEKASIAKTESLEKDRNQDSINNGQSNDGPNDDHADKTEHKMNNGDGDTGDKDTDELEKMMKPEEHNSKTEEKKTEADEKHATSKSQQKPSVDNDDGRRRSLSRGETRKRSDRSSRDKDRGGSGKSDRRGDHNNPRKISKDDASSSKRERSKKRKSHRDHSRSRSRSPENGGGEGSPREDDRRRRRSRQHRKDRDHSSRRDKDRRQNKYHDDNDTDRGHGRYDRRDKDRHEQPLQQNDDHRMGRNYPPRMLHRSGGGSPPPHPHMMQRGGPDFGGRGGPRHDGVGRPIATHGPQLGGGRRSPPGDRNRDMPLNYYGGGRGGGGGNRGGPPVAFYGPPGGRFGGPPPPDFFGPGDNHHHRHRGGGDNGGAGGRRERDRRL